MNRKVLLIGDKMYRHGLSLSSKISIVSAFGDRAVIDTLENEKYDAVVTGYISDPKEILNIREYICDLKLDNPTTFVMVDPVLGKNGALYDGITDDHVTNYKKLIEIADLITPNLTEACFLTESSYEEYRDKYIIIKHENDEKAKTDALSKKIIESMFVLFDKLRIKKNQATIITGIEMYDSILTILDIFDGDHGKRQTTCNYSEKREYRFGAGDIFDAMYIETFMAGFNTIDALSVTTSFINNSLRFSKDQKCKESDGIMFEPILYDNIVVIRKRLKEMREKINKGNTR